MGGNLRRGPPPRPPPPLLWSKYNLPPGPRPWPVIGNLNLIGPLPRQSIHALSQKPGPIMHLRFGSSPVVVGSSAELAKEFLKTHDATLAGRPKFSATALKDCLSTLGLNVISRMVLGKKYLKKAEKGQNYVVSSEEFKKMMDELFFLNGVLNIGDFIPWINFLDLQGYVKRMKEVAKKFDRFMEHVLDEHNERRGGKLDYVATDMVDLLLQVADDPTLEVKLERHGVKAFTQDLIAGGTESSAVTVEWAMSELLRKPEIIKKAAVELDRVIGRERWMEEKDIPNLPYIIAIAKETMRLHPVTPMLIPRLARDDVKVAGYDIPKGTQVLVNTWTIGRDPVIWEKPNEFEPERFLGKNIDVKGHDYEFLPFGLGRRMCPGYPLGLKVIQTSLVNLLHGFHWRLQDGMKKEDLSMEEVFGLSTPRKLPLEPVLQPRLASHLSY